MNGMEGIFGIIGIGAGLYSLYAWFQLKFKGIINTSILVPKDTNIKKCKDKEAYRAAAGPKLLVLAVVLILYGAEDLYNTYVMGIKENVMREMKCRKIPIRFRMEPY